MPLKIALLKNQVIIIIKETNSNPAHVEAVIAFKVVAG